MHAAGVLEDFVLLRGFCEKKVKLCQLFDLYLAKFSDSAIWSEFVIDWVMLFIRRLFSNSGSQFEDPT
jgi:hypothetical protein